MFVYYQNSHLSFAGKQTYPKINYVVSGRALLPNRFPWCSSNFAIPFLTQPQITTNSWVTSVRVQPEDYWMKSLQSTCLLPYHMF